MKLKISLLVLFSLRVNKSVLKSLEIIFVWWCYPVDIH